MTPLLEAQNLVKHFVADRSVFGRPTAFIKAAGMALLPILLLRATSAYIPGSWRFPDVVRHAGVVPYSG